MRKLFWPGMTILIALSIAAGLALGGNGETNDKNFQYAIGLSGAICLTTTCRRLPASPT